MKKIVFLTLILTGCFSKKEASDEPVQVIGENILRISEEAMSNLKIATAENRDFPEVLSVTGKISPTEDRMHVVPSRATGRIEQVLIASGESVVAGQPLASIWSPDFVAAREEFIQSIRQDKKMAGNSDNDFKSLSNLARKKLESLGLSQKDIDALSMASDSKDADAPVKNLIVRAPRSGAVISKNAIVGNSVNLGDTLFMIADLHEVWFLGDMYPEDLTKVKKNQKVVIEGTTPGSQVEGKVSFISPIVDPNSRTIKIRALMNNANLNLRGDMYVQGHLILEDRTATMIPAQAVLHDLDANYVFKILEPKMVEGHSIGIEARKMKVSILGERQGLVAIAEGIQAGEKVVSDGALLLNAALNNSSSNGNGK